MEPGLARSTIAMITILKALLSKMLATAMFGSTQTDRREAGDSLRQGRDQRNHRAPKKVLAMPVASAKSLGNHGQPRGGDKDQRCASEIADHRPRGRRSVQRTIRRVALR